RILRNGKIGFADERGKIVISPQFACAFPFDNGKAKVAYECVNEKEFDHIISKSDAWFFINHSGKRVE
ncbi:MAG: WG repeat-containing protein, partial [Bacteroidota bacterium]